MTDLDGEESQAKSGSEQEEEVEEENSLFDDWNRQNCRRFLAQFIPSSKF
jgi:hypothetical protein